MWRVSCLILCGNNEVRDGALVTGRVVCLKSRFDGLGWIGWDELMGMDVRGGFWGLGRDGMDREVRGGTHGCTVV